MRRPSEKRCINDDSNKNENEEGDQENIENLIDDISNSGEDSRDSMEDELMKDKLMEDVHHEMMEDDKDRQPQEPTPKKPKFRHRKIILYVASETEMNELQKLEAELQKKSPDKKFVKKAMDTTFPQRRRWIQEECPSVQDILFKYPIFKNSKYVSSYSCYIYSYRCL